MNRAEQLLSQISENKPRIFYRGLNEPDLEIKRINTGNRYWDSLLFVSSDINQARNYGDTILVFEALPQARILYEGTREFLMISRMFRPRPNFVEYCASIVREASRQGYHAVWFKMQGNIGTAICDRSMFRQIKMLRKD